MWGIDFVIHVVVKDVPKEVLESFGPLFGEWTEEQEKAADTVITCILIQTQNHLKADAAKWALSECIPDKNKFDYYNPSNPFVSILMELGLGDSNGVQVVNPHTGKDIHRKQLPIVAYGLTARTYKCLDGCENVERMLKLLITRDGPQPLKGFEESTRSCCRFTGLSTAKVPSRAGRLDLLEMRMQGMILLRFCYDFYIYTYIVVA